MPEFEVTISNVFEVDTPEEAVLAMAAWLYDHANRGGYRVESFLDDSVNVFIDAGELNFG